MGNFTVSIENLYQSFKKYGATREILWNDVGYCIDEGYSTSSILPVVRAILAIDLLVPDKFDLNDFAMYVDFRPEEIMEEYKETKEVLKIGSKYRGKLQGITLLSLIIIALKNGLSNEEILTGIKKMLKTKFDQKKNFTARDLANTFGMSIFEAKEFIAGRFIAGRFVNDVVENALTCNIPQ